MKLTTRMKLAIAGVAALGIYAYAKSQSKCPPGSTWKATATGGYCAKPVCTGCVEDAGSTSLGGMLGDLTDYAKGLGTSLENAFSGFTGPSSPDGGDGPITSPAQLPDA